MQGRTSPARPATVLATSAGSAMCARVMPMRSAMPLARTSSACASVRIRPVTIVGRRVAAAMLALSPSS
jgi:hypothetical protein